MTIFVADVAIYQGALTPDALLAAGFTGINVKISHGLTQKSVHPRAASWLADTRFTRSTFHYLTGEAGGQDQAAYSFSRLRALVPSGPVAHVVDVEDSGITPAIYQDYVATMAVLLGRPIATYSGSWYTATRPWVSAPWMWAAPAGGYLKAYPGDTSSSWGTLSVMQYAVLPIAGIDVSMSAIRNPAVWDAMRGVGMAWQLTAGLSNLRAQVNERWPLRDKASDGTIGNAVHESETSGHNPDDTPGSRPAWNGDPDTTQEVRAWDMDTDLNEPGTTAQMLEDHLRALPGLAGVLRYMIYNRTMYHSRDGFAPTDYTGASAHEEHIHFEGAWTQAADNNVTFNYKLEEVGQMPLTADEKNAIIDGVVAKLKPSVDAIPRAVFAFDPGKQGTDGSIYPGISDATYTPGGNGTVGLGTAISSILARQKGYGDSDRAAAAQLLSAVQSASGVPADVLAAALVGPLSAAILAGLPVGHELTKEAVQEAMVEVLHSVTP